MNLTTSSNLRLNLNTELRDFMFPVQTGLLLPTKLKCVEVNCKKNKKKQRTKNKKVICIYTKLSTVNDL